MKQICSLLIAVIFSGLIGGCSSLYTEVHGTDSFEELLEFAKQAFTGDGMPMLQHMDYSDLTQQEIEQYKKTRLTTFFNGAVGKVFVWNQTEYETLLSKGRVGRVDWNTPPEKVILIKQKGDTPDAFLAGNIYGVFERNGKWYFCRD
ncbi:hypothetical protein P4C99_00490 [Pontiellaceae bacterium B1224]|nr:hypothetical protein [Pontiellaceae bacterium B1224]